METCTTKNYLCTPCGLLKPPKKNVIQGCKLRQVNLFLNNEASNAAGEWDQYTIHLKSHVLGYRLLK